MTEASADVRAHLEWLTSQVAALESLADKAETGEDPQLGPAVAARTKAAELRKKVEQLREWLARRPLAPRSRGKSKAAQALLLIVAGRSTGEVAHELGVDPRTVRRWRADPDFDEQLRDLQTAQTEALHALLVASQLDVARCLVATATGPDTSDMARVGAARVFFELLGRHKGSPVAPVLHEAEMETEEDVLDALKDIPAAILQRAIDEQTAAREAKAVRKRATVKSL
jgi:hypothetical protein